MTLTTLLIVAPPFGTSPGIPVSPIADRSFVDPRAGTVVRVPVPTPDLETVDPRAGTVILV